MDIKEIALKVADSLRNKVDGISHMQSNQGLVAFAEALISAYKAELLKEVGEPFGFYYEINGTWDAFVVGETEPDDDVYDEGSLKALFTSDQFAATVLKATGPLEREIEKLSDSAYATSERLNVYIRDNDELRTQLASAQEEIKTVTEQKNRMWFEMQTAQDQLAKAEQRVAEYNELIYAVQTKHHDETRHQTALRYIRNAENRQSYTAANGASI